MRSVLPWLILLAVIVVAVVTRPSDTAALVDSLTARVDSFAAHEAEHEAMQDSLDGERQRADSLGALLRVGSQVIRAAADARAAVAFTEAVQAETSTTAADSASHWEAAYRARTEEADSLRRVVALQDEARAQDSIAKAAAVQALLLERARSDSAETLVVELRGVVEELRPHWTDDVILGAGVEPWSGRPTVLVGYRVASLGDIARRLPGWLRP